MQLIVFVELNLSEENQRTTVFLAKDTNARRNKENEGAKEDLACYAPKCKLQLILAFH